MIGCSAESTRDTRDACRARFLRQRGDAGLRRCGLPAPRQDRAGF